MLGDGLTDEITSKLKCVKHPSSKGEKTNFLAMRIKRPFACFGCFIVQKQISVPLYFSGEIADLQNNTRLDLMLN